MKSIFAMLTIVFGTGYAHASPVTTFIDSTSVALAQMLFETSGTVQLALDDAGIPAEAKMSSGKVTRFGSPGDYTDQYEFGMTLCGPTLTSPCRVEGTLTIKKWTRINPGAAPKVQYIITATK